MCLSEQISLSYISKPITQHSPASRFSLCSRFPWLSFSSYAGVQVCSAEMGMGCSVGWCHSTPLGVRYKQSFSQDFGGKPKTLNLLWRRGKTSCLAHFSLSSTMTVSVAKSEPQVELNELWQLLLEYTTLNQDIHSGLGDSKFGVRVRMCKKYQCSVDILCVTHTQVAFSETRHSRWHKLNWLNTKEEETQELARLLLNKNVKTCQDSTGFTEIRNQHPYHPPPRKCTKPCFSDSSFAQPT